MNDEDVKKELVTKDDLDFSQRGERGERISQRMKERKGGAPLSRWGRLSHFASAGKKKKKGGGTLFWPTRKGRCSSFLVIGIRASSHHHGRRKGEKEVEGARQEKDAGIIETGRMEGEKETDSAPSNFEVWGRRISVSSLRG